MGSRNSPIYAVMYREGPVIASHLSPAVRLCGGFQVIGMPENADLKCADALRGILSGVWKSLGKSNNTV
ncbi:hypothetical protein CO656_19860 [Sinorhizobium sp. FG01]|uniref:Uncharacterized protein n=1 Tax=Rhizobium fredii TaxID=380 RepID=A0A2L0H3P5_RHIFR|nr:hypothetical protein NXT3_CH01523 [Sinorhizobium fredii]PDT39909.1 hypothetical protein CO656_19860 [Sinorhizobium sp. FG01]